MLKSLLGKIRRAFCRHHFQPSRSWAGMEVCRKCGVRQMMG